MGIKIDQVDFSKEAFNGFSEKLQDNLQALNGLIQQPEFGRGESSFGAELEVYLIDQNHQAVRLNQQVAQQLNHPQLQQELNQFNLEWNLSPLPLKGSPFSAVEEELKGLMSVLDRALLPQGASWVNIGILPTLRLEDLHESAITPLPRYLALSDGIRRLRGEPFHVSISGEDPIDLKFPDVTLEGANTSFQFHWRMQQHDFVNCFNAVQLVTPLVLALAANSPYLLGHRLWDETRIALFKQAIDYRQESEFHWKQPARVNYGFGWLRNSPWELFAENVALFPPLLPISSTENSLETLADGGVPELGELCLHQGTIWSWNRAIYDPTDQGHIRMECRTLPAGPSFQDMLANSALIIALAEALKPHMAELTAALPFSYALQNFYRTAQSGLEANIIWPAKVFGKLFPGTSLSRQAGLSEVPVIKAIQSLLPLAEEALVRTGVAESEAQTYLGLAIDRLEARVNGAIWQKAMVKKITRTHSLQEALALMLERYVAEQQGGRPIVEWSYDL